jgi:hypothetical protein
VGLINMNGRIYDPKLARFLTPDPRVSRPFKSQSFNRYSYAENSPVMRVDPTGFQDEDAGDAGGDSSPSGDAAPTGPVNTSPPPTDPSVPTTTATINDASGNPAASEQVPCDSDCGGTATTVEVTGPAADDQGPGSTTPVDGPSSGSPTTVSGRRRVDFSEIPIDGSPHGWFGDPAGRIPESDRSPPPQAYLVPVNKYGEPPRPRDRVFFLHQDALKSLQALREVARESGFDREIFSLRSAFRDQGQQNHLYKNAAHPGRGTAKLSEHITGRAFDLFLGLPNDLDLADTGAFDALESYQWLKNNAGLFGLNPYSAEPWHWSYNVIDEGE